MEHKLATAEKRVLVELVRLVQKRGLQGESGGWKEFLDVYDKKIGSSLSDPSRRTSEVLVAFLTTFKKKEDLQLFAKVVQCNTNRALIEKFKEESPDKETPEQRLVRMTLEHPEYPVDFSFPSFAEGWFVTEIRGKKSTVVKSTKMIAIDCEMVLCEDGSEAVVRVGAVNRDLKVVLDKFVKPNQPIVDYRTDITGVTAGDLENATLTVADIQKKLRRYLANGTILVGHSLHNDLKVLKIDHTRVIDTSLVFKYFGTGKPRRPSLNNLCKTILGNEVRKDGDPHNCVHDASAAMKLVLAVVEKGVDTSILPSKDMLESEKAKLLLHRIPHNVQSEELKGVISGEFSLDVMPAKRQGGFYSAIVAFNSPEEANQAFDNIEGDRLKDQKGLPQKLVGFKVKSGTEASLYVRKMVFDESMEVKPATKRSCPEDDDDNNKVNAKKQKKEEVANCEIKEMREEKTEHLKEIEELKLKLKSKDFQIQAQDKIIASLKKQLEKKKTQIR